MTTIPPSSSSTTGQLSSVTTSQSSAVDSASSNPGTDTSTQASTSLPASSSSTALTTSSTSPSSTSTTSTTSTSSSTTSTTSAVPTTSSPATSSSSTHVVVSTDPNGGVFTSTSIVAITPSRSIAASTESATAGKSFLQNTGAVAGVFTVVGLVVLAILIALITNGLRRRRAKRFDREIEAEAAAAAAAVPPVFLDDDDDLYGHSSGAGGYGSSSGGGGGPGAYGGFSDASSHGTYAQPAMSPEAYGMRELNHTSGIAPGEIFDPSTGAYVAGAAGAGAAGIGIARARSMRDGGGYAAALQEGGSPYPAFAAPNANAGGNVQGQHGEGAYGHKGPGSAEFDLLEAAGIVPGVGAGAGLARGQSQYNSQAQYQQQQGLSRNQSMGAYDAYAAAHPTPGSTDYQQQQYPPQQQQQNLSRNQSLGSHDAFSHPASGSGSASPPQQPESYAAHYQPGYQATREEDDADAAYGGYTVSDEAHDTGVGAGKRQSTLPNPFSGDSTRRHDEYADDSDEEEVPQRRVLKIANE